MGHGVHEAVPRLPRWGALDAAAASADGLGGGIGKRLRLPNARSPGPSIDEDSVPELLFLFLFLPFFDPARLARIRVGVWGTSLLLVQVDVNRCKGDGTWRRLG
jgi:hypothetical protein